MHICVLTWHAHDVHVPLVVLTPPAACHALIPPALQQQGQATARQHPHMTKCAKACNMLAQVGCTLLCPCGAHNKLQRGELALSNMLQHLAGPNCK
jgi:hypothetical protein